MKLKEGYCEDCNDGKLKSLIAKKCQMHYWNAARKKSQKKTAVIKKTPVRIKKVSRSQASRTRRYLILRKLYLSLHEICEAKICCEGALAIEIHHKAGKVGDNYFKFFLAVCRACHDWIEAHPEESKKLGFSINRLT